MLPSLRSPGISGVFPATDVITPLLYPAHHATHTHSHQNTSPTLLPHTHGPTIAAATSHAPVSLVAGSWHSEQVHPRSSSASHSSRGKGKWSYELLLESSSDNEKPIAKHGHLAGAGNYTEGDLSQLLTLVAIRQWGWKKVHKRFVKWTKKNNQPEQDCKSIETKYKQVCSLLFIFSTILIVVI